MEVTENKKGFVELALPYVGALYFYAFLLTNDYAKAGKLVLKTYEKAYRFFNHHSPGSNIKCYLFRVLNNSLPWGLSKPADTEKAETIGVDFDKVSLETVETELKDIDSNTISKSISTLPGNIKKVISLYQVGAFTTEEIAELIDVPEGVVLSRLYTGRKLLLEKFAKEKHIPLKNIDGELSYQEKKKIVAFVENKSEEDGNEKIKPEVRLHQLIEKILNSNLFKEKPPAELEGNIRVRFSSTFEEKLTGSIKASRSKRYVAYSTIVMFVVLIVAILIYEPDIKKPKNFAAEQKGRNNLLIQLQNTFKEFRTGKFELIEGNAEALKNYLHQKGLENVYSIFSNKTLKLTGWFINEMEKGTFVFLVYKDEFGKTVLMHQSTIEKLKNGTPFSLTGDLLEFLLNGRCYSTIKDNFLCLLKREGSNIFAFATELPAKDLIMKICKQKRE